MTISAQGGAKQGAPIVAIARRAFSQRFREWFRKVDHERRVHAARVPLDPVVEDFAGTPRDR
jgi:hypothetical protein